MQRTRSPELFDRREQAHRYLWSAHDYALRVTTTDPFSLVKHGPSRLLVTWWHDAWRAR